MSLLSVFKADPFKFRRIAEKSASDLSHVTDALHKNQTGFTRAELAREVAAEIEREQSESTAQAKKQHLEATAALRLAEERLQAGEAREYRKRLLADQIRTGLEAIERLEADIASNPAVVAEHKKEMARAASDLAKRPDDFTALRIFNTQAESLAVLPHHLDAAKSALQILQNEVAVAQRELSAIK